MTPVAGGEFTPDGLYDSGGDSTTLETGKYTDDYISYNVALGACACWTTGSAVVQCLAHEEVHASRSVRFKFQQCDACVRKDTTN